MSAKDYARSRIDALFASIDRSDADEFSNFLSDDASFRFGSAPPVTGRSKIAAAVGAFFASISGCKHEVSNTIAHNDTLICEGDVTYTRHDGSEVTVPFVDVFEIANELIDEYKIYIDISPLFAS